MKIALTEFAGTAPKLDRVMLADDLAQEAVNVGFDMGLLSGALISTVPSTEFAGLPAGVQAIAKPASINARLAFTGYLKGGVYANMLAPSDTWGRVYFLGYNFNTSLYRLYFTTKDNYTAGGLTVDPTRYTLGVPAPVAPAVIYEVAIDKTALEVEAGTEVTLDMQKSAYVFTIVDAYGHEGPPSVPTAIVDLPYDAPFAARMNIPAQTFPSMNMVGGRRRFYRASFDGSTSDWQFVADLPIETLSWSDQLPLGQEGETLVSTDWVQPPEMDDFTVVNGSFLAGCRANQVMYSAYLLPHAWPESLRFPLPYTVVAIKSTLGGLFIGTNGAPFWASGTDPAAAVPVNLGLNLPCLSAASVVDMGGWVIYASHDGLVSAEAGGVTLLSGDFVDRMRWLRDFNPASIKAFGHEGDYYFSVNNSDWWVFNATAGRGLRKVTLQSIVPSAVRQVMYDSARDTTVMVVAGGKVHDVVSAQDPSQTFKWASKEFFRSPVQFSTAQVVSSQYPVTLTVTGDGVAERYVALNERPFRLKPLGRKTRWSLSVEANALARVSSFAVCQSPSELVNG